MKNKRVLAVVPLIIVMFAVLFHPRPLANVLPIKVDGLQDFSCRHMILQRMKRMISPWEMWKGMLVPYCKCEVGPTIEAIVEEDKRYFINIDHTCYVVVSGEELWKDLIVQIQRVSSFTS